MNDVTSAWRRSAARLMAAAAVIATAGCGESPESRYYLLTPEANTAELARAEGAGPVVLVSEATVSPYFDRSQMVSRDGEYRIAFDEFEVWAEPINHLVTRKLVDDLARRFGRNRVLGEKSGRAFDGDYGVGAEVLRFDSVGSVAPDGAIGAGRVTVDLRWTVASESRNCLIATDRAIVTRSYGDPASFDARVQAYSDALSEISNAIGDAIDGAGGAACL